MLAGEMLGPEFKLLALPPPTHKIPGMTLGDHATSTVAGQTDRVGLLAAGTAPGLETVIPQSRAHLCTYTTHIPKRHSISYVSGAAVESMGLWPWSLGGDTNSVLWHLLSLTQQFVAAGGHSLLQGYTGPLTVLCLYVWLTQAWSSEWRQMRVFRGSLQMQSQERSCTVYSKFRII